MLRSSDAGSVILLNGVPAIGGGVRPPTNWTWIVDPENREMLPKEEFQIEFGKSVSIRLPNGAEVLIRAE